MKTRLAVMASVAAILFSQQTFAKNLCTLIVDAESGKVLLESGNDCSGEVTPASTFKIAISLMGFDAGVLKNEKEPAWDYQQGYPDWGGKNWMNKIDPTAWLKYSVFWYSQQVVKKIGQHRFEDYVKAFAYGNEDVSAVDVSAPGQNGVWVMSSLQISPVQQIGFLRKVVNRELHVNKHAYDMTDNITRYDVSVKGWTVHGKTGTGSPGKNNQYDPHHAYGWYVGWATKGRKKIVFAKLIQDEQVLTPNAGLRARDEVLKQMSAVIAP